VVRECSHRIPSPLYAVDESLDFSHAERERAAAYHRPLYAALAVDLAVGAGVLATLAWGAPGRWASSAVESLPWAAAAAGYAGIVVAVSALVRLPLAWWRGWLRERRWGFSTQGLGSWAADRAKALAVSASLTAAAWTGAVALARALPGWWAVPAAGALALAVLLLSFVAPLVLEPLFNRFVPLADA
jgi:STE24 endopeptidase